MKRKPTYISPKEFLKARRPNQFSDTLLSDVEAIDRVHLDYYLETLSKRNQDKEFENYAKRLCELKICPNLQPNTGPDAGGDGKVDTQTLPVSEKIQLGWYVGVPSKTGKDRWAFAFSLKEDWRAKVRADVKSISETRRGYKVAYFVTSQYVKASERSKLEDELKEKYSIEVRIIDKTWLLDTTFKDNYQNVAIETLSMPVEKHQEVEKGSRDTAREKELAELDKKITNDISKEAVIDHTVEMAVRTAILSRELEKPRHEIEGRLERAVRLAEEHGSIFVRSEAHYQKAWTTFWWFEDYVLFKDLYLRAEAVILKMDNSFNLEKLSNLWNLLSSVREQDKSLVAKKFFEERTNKLKERLEELASDDTKLSGPLYAKSLLLLMELRIKALAGEDLSETFAELGKIVDDSKYLVGFPMRSLVEIVTVISDIFEDSIGYDSLFNRVVETAQERDGDIAAAELCLVRASKQLRSNKNYAAIRTLGSVLRKIHKDETKEDAMRALYIMGLAYKNAGLYWAARGSFLTAGSLAANDLWNNGEVNEYQLACYEELKWIELKLGRLAHMLEWYRTDSYVRGVLVSQGRSEEELSKPTMPFDICLGVTLLRANYNELALITKLPKALTELGFSMADDASFYALGHEEDMSQEFQDAMPKLEREQFMSDWASCYEESVHPSKINNEDGEVVEMRSIILGCEVTINSENSEGAIEVGETILGALEALLATAQLQRIVTFEQYAKININNDDSAQTELIKATFEDDGDRPVLNITIAKAFSPFKISQADQDIIRKTIDDAVIHLMARIVFIESEKEIEELVKGSMDRALNFTGSLVHLGNILGYKPKHKLAEWTSGKLEYPISRPLDYDGLKPPRKVKTEQKSKKGDQEPKILDPEEVKHTEIKVASVIRNNLWDQAKWVGAGYAYTPGKPPILALMFNDIEAGKKIFEAWRKQFGDHDENDQIRITVAKGVDVKNPMNYRMTIRANVESMEKEEVKRVAVISRVHTMEPTTKENLDNFLGTRAAYGCYWIAPAFPDPIKGLQIEFSHTIMKQEFYLREAWEIGANDLDGPLVRGEDNPIIPTVHEKDAPVLELLKRYRGM